MNKNKKLSDLIQPEFYIFDLEWTAWPDSNENNWSAPGEYREIVEIGAIKIIRHKNMLVIDEEFSCLVLPCINKQLSKYFINLTGIHQSELDEKGLNFQKALDLFCSFINLDKRIYSFGSDFSVIEENIKLHNSKTIIDEKAFFDFRPIICSAFNLNLHVCSSELPKETGISADYDKHRALGDVYAQFAVLRNYLEQTI